LIQYRIHPEAEEEYQEAYAYYQVESSKLAEQFTQEIIIGLQSIIDAPQTWPMIKFNVRRRLLRKFPFGILYLTEGKSVLILAFMHLRREPEYWHHRAAREN
jgi:plasmid stabilization system protein ParE